jgi:hypothetical protein
MTFIQGIVSVKNVSGAEYTIEEIDYTMQDQEVVDLLNTGLPNHYEDWESAKRLVTTLTTAKLYQDIQAGNVVVDEIKEPMGR